jgi:hypothetical protein
VRRVKNPNRCVLLGLGAGAGAGPLLVLRALRSCWTSCVGPRADARVAGGNEEDGFGEGIRAGGFAEALILDLEVCAGKVLDSEEGVRLCNDRKFIMLLWITGDGPRSPDISGVPSLLGLDGRLPVGIDTGD